MYKHILKDMPSLSFSIKQLLLDCLIPVHPYPVFKCFLWFLGRECLGAQGTCQELSVWGQSRRDGEKQAYCKAPPHPQGSLPTSPFPPHASPPAPVWDFPFACWCPLPVRGSMRAKTLADCL